MALFALESQYLPPTENYNSLYELAPFPFGSSDTLDDNVNFFPDHVFDLDQNGFWSMGNYQTDLFRTLDPVPTYDAFLSLFLSTQPATTPVDVATMISAPSVESDVQPADPSDKEDEDADYDLDPDFVDFATERLPCQSPVSSAPPSPLSPLPDTDDEDSDTEEPVYEESEYEEPESLSGSRKRGRVSDLRTIRVTIYRTDAMQSRSRSGDFKNSLERYAFHNDPQHVRCMKPDCRDEFNSVNAAIDHMHSAHPRKEESKVAKKAKATKKSKVAKKTKAAKKSKATTKSKATEELTVVRCIYFGCDKDQKSVGDMRRHLISVKHQCPRFQCGDCKGLFQRPDPVKRHQRKFEGRCKGVYVENRPVRQRVRRA